KTRSRRRERGHRRHVGDQDERGARCDRQQRPNYRFDFQTHSWHTNTMSTAPLATLPGRPCPVAAALEVVGERWALLVVREIALGANRFSAIVAGTGAPRDRIAARLRTLEDA